MQPAECEDVSLDSSFARKSLNLRSVKPAGVASGVSWDSFGGDGSRPGKLQSQHIAEEFWKTPP
jgi:hypothetical protein